MPIRPEQRDLYPPDWPAISLTVRTEAGWRCECAGECGRNHFPAPLGFYNVGAGSSAGAAGQPARCFALQGFPHPVTESRVVLTVAHLNHDPADCRRDNLRAMCQRCHLAYDRELHAATRAQTRATAAGLVPLFDLEAETC